MPASDDGSGRILVWLISCFLFSSIAGGGACLIIYMVLLPDSSKQWLPVAGVILVCLPWAFWFLMCFYRIVSRAFGFRVILGGLNAGPDAQTRATGKAMLNDPNNSKACPEHDGHGSPVVQMGDPECGKNSSTRSHESEMPLTSAMAS